MLRPACLSDVQELIWRQVVYGIWDRDTEIEASLENLYTAEWRKRGFERSP